MSHEICGCEVACRHATQPAQPGERDEPLDHVLVVAANPHADQARVRPAGVAFRDTERRLTLEKSGEKALVELADAHGERGHAQMLRPVPAENPCNER
jgi:hypothetical protein